MKFLLFFVSLIFSFIFYIFYSLSKWRDIFFNTISNSYDLASFSWNLLIESFSFALLSIFFLYLFSNLKEKWTYKIKTHKIDILYFLFYVILIYYLYFLNKNLDNYLYIIIFLFVLSDITFNHISNISRIKKQKIKLKYFWLIINYLASALILYYIYSNGISFLTSFLIIFSIFFNALVHKKYSNYVSLLISIITAIFLIYFLFFYLFELYISYI